MGEIVMILDEKHKQVAIEIVQKNRKKKSCGKCYDRGFEGFSSEDNTIIPCNKCVDTEKAFEEWKVYVSTDEQLKEDFKELFEEDEKTDEKSVDEEVSNIEEDHLKTKTQSTTNVTSVKSINKNVAKKPSVQRRSQGRGK
jgi:hypothetical protein